jgi:hypothetical protein
MQHVSFAVVQIPTIGGRVRGWGGKRAAARRAVGDLLPSLRGGSLNPVNSPTDSLDEATFCDRSKL